MFNLPAVKESLKGLVGFRQVTEMNIDPIDVALTTSRSGLFIDRAHALITPTNLIGAAVDLYPQTTENGPLSDLITRVYEDATAKVIQALRTRKLLRADAKLMLPKTQLFDGEGSINELIQPANRFVGLRFVTNDYELGLNFQTIGLQFSGVIPALPIRFYTGDMNTLLGTFPVAYSRPGRMQFLDLNDFVMSGSASYIVGYSESDLPPGVMAVRRNSEISEAICAGCSPNNSYLQKRWQQYVVKVDAVRVDYEGAPIDDVQKQNYGLNFAFSVGCDLTSLINDQSIALADALQQQIVCILLDEMAFSSQITTIEQQVRQNAKFALENSERGKLEKAINALDINLSGLDSRCLIDTTTVQRPTRRTVYDLTNNRR